MGVTTTRQSLRVVLDTNVLVSALLYRDGELAWLPGAWLAGKVVPLASEPVIGELQRILLQLGQRKFGLEALEIEQIVARYLAFTESVKIDVDDGTSMPKCRDPDDQKFLELAERGQADVLVTSDQLLLGLSRRTPFAILPPVKFRERLSGLGLL
jgi:uncharacterized protein